MEDMLQLAPFMDYSTAWNRGNDSRNDTLHSVGVGLIFTPRPKMSAELYWAHDIEARATAQDYNLQDDGIHFQFRYNVF
jgi:hemolysin activation/secretion protein